MTPDEKMAAVFVSILASPVKLGLYDNPEIGYEEKAANFVDKNCRVQEHIAEIYGDVPLKASGMIIDRCGKIGVEIVGLHDAEYPSLLKEIHRPPFVLYVKGNMPVNRMVSIVGTRNSCRESEDIARRISSTLACSGFTVVSGMAVGIDRFAHLGALDAGGSTVGVLPGGIDSLYPYRNRDLFSRIVSSEASALVSENPPGIISSHKWTFARRNRIISGMSSSLVIVEAPRGSGAMITARYAIEQNRELFVCTGNAFDQRFSGCHDLIRDGAAVVSGMEDIFSVIEPGYLADSICRADKSSDSVDLNFQSDKSNIPAVKGAESIDISSYSGVERDLLESLQSGCINIDIFARKFSYTPDLVSRAITSLEIEGLITRKGNSILLK